MIDKFEFDFQHFVTMYSHHVVTYIANCSKGSKTIGSVYQIRQNNEGYLSYGMTSGICGKEVEK